MTVIIAHSDMRELFEAYGIDPDALGVKFASELGRVDDGIRFIFDECQQLMRESAQLLKPKPERPYYRQRQRW